VHKKKRKFDHQHFLNRPRRRPRDLDHLATSQSQSFTSHRSSSPQPDSQSYREPVAEDYEPVGPPGAGEQAEDYYEEASEVTDRGDRYEVSPIYDSMAGDPSRMTIARRGKLVTFYRNGDPHYKVGY